MSFKSKIISVSTAAVLTLSLTCQTMAAGTPFTDLNNVSSKDKILELQKEGYVGGVADGIFAPQQTLTMAEGIKLIVNTFGLNIDNVRFIKAPKATDYFKNADDNAWYADTLIIASVNDLGLPQDIDPNAEMTREEFTYYLIHAMEKYGNLPMINIVPKDIADNDQITVEYSGAIQRALVYKIVSLTDGKFNPKAEITRADAAEMVYNTLSYLKEHPSPNTSEN
ncbi:MAG: S-layer homology domain-containing protein [Bacillota bacterium]|nr:S-layer homology domain-containing protein [Bacillota bacterium]